jgi:2'-hydroxyisoflavone reductase
MAQLLQTCAAVSGSEASFTWVSDEFLLAQEVAPYTEMPLWVPAVEAGFGRVNCQKAISAGLTYRPLSETVEDTLTWANGRGPTHEWRNGMTPEREAELLQLWHTHRR